MKVRHLTQLAPFLPTNPIESKIVKQSQVIIYGNVSCIVKTLTYLIYWQLFKREDRHREVGRFAPVSSSCADSLSVCFWLLSDWFQRDSIQSDLSCV